MILWLLCLTTSSHKIWSYKWMHYCQPRWYVCYAPCLSSINAESLSYLQKCSMRWYVWRNMTLAKMDQGKNRVQRNCGTISVRVVCGCSLISSLWSESKLSHGWQSVVAVREKRRITHLIRYRDVKNPFRRFNPDEKAWVKWNTNTEPPRQ